MNHSIKSGLTLFSLCSLLLVSGCGAIGKALSIVSENKPVTKLQNADIQ